MSVNGFDRVELEKKRNEKQQYYNYIKKRYQNRSDIIMRNWDGHFRTCDDLRLKCQLFRNESDRAKNENRKLRLYREYKQNYFKNMSQITEYYCDIIGSISGETLPAHTIEYLLETINRFEQYLDNGPENMEVDEISIIDDHTAKLQELYCALNSAKVFEEEEEEKEEEEK
jgi:hypothetical protein